MYSKYSRTHSTVAEKHSLDITFWVGHTYIHIYIIYICFIYKQLKCVILYTNGFVTRLDSRLINT